MAMMPVDRIFAVGDELAPAEDGEVGADGGLGERGRGDDLRDGELAAVHLVQDETANGVRDLQRTVLRLIDVERTDCVRQLPSVVLQ